MSHSSESTSLDIAIVGLSGRFPKAKNIDEFWQNLKEGIESIEPVSKTELTAAGVDPNLLTHPDYVPMSSSVGNIDSFDAAFFGFSPREAEQLDPQNRIFLECAWEALESAGYTAEQYEGLIGVYGGASPNGYFLNNLHPHRFLQQAPSPMGPGNMPGFLTTNVSYKLNLKGPSINVQTFCSTSLVSVHLACQGLLNYECDMALAGGVSLQVPHQVGYFYQEGGILSPDGHCRAFDAEAQGTIFGSGAGVVLLKRLSDAIADGDYIHALVKGSAINNDGSLKASYTASSVEGQADVISECLTASGVSADSISYIEAHGTGTNMGDPIEVAALTEAFQTDTARRGYCAIGSVKTNIGHLDAAAGIAGLIKTVLALKHRQIPPSLHFERPNPKIDFASTPFYINHTLTDWSTDQTPRRAGVSALGFGGTNAHVILEEAPPSAPHETARPYQLLLLSAKTQAALDQATTNLANHLKANPGLNLADIAYTLKRGRQVFNHRRMLVCRGLAEGAIALFLEDSPQLLSQVQDLQDRPVIFMFSGQGGQYPNMGRDLYDTEPVFQAEVDRCCELLKRHLDLDLRDVLYPLRTEKETNLTPETNNTEQPAILTETRERSASEKLKQAAIAQPALFVIEYALAQLWMAWGVIPESMIGHSLGEYVAACLSGVFSLETALALVAQRAQLMQSMPAGSMMAVSLTPEALQPLLAPEIEIAALNGPERTVVSGPDAAIAAFQKLLEAKGNDCRPLQTSHAFHSGMMEPILETFQQAIANANPNPPQIPFISNVTGTWITPQQAQDPKYWTQHLRQPVRFGPGLETLCQETTQSVLLEVGPGNVLATLSRRHPSKAPEQKVFASLRHPQDEQSDNACLMDTVGQLWLSGVNLDWERFYAHERRQRVPLPTYPFQRQRYWVEPPQLADLSTARASDVASPSAHNLDKCLTKKTNIKDWFYLPSWKRSLAPTPALEALPTQQCWLLFMDDCQVGIQLLAKLKAANQVAIAVVIGPDFKQQESNVYTLNPNQPEDYRSLSKVLKAQHQLPEHIIHLWNITPDVEPQSMPPAQTFESAQAAQALGLYSLLSLMQALGNNDWCEQLNITVISNNRLFVTGTETLAPEKAPLQAACIVIPQEYLHVRCQSIDIVLPTTEEALTHQIITPLWHKLVDKALDTDATTNHPPVVAYRGAYRWLPAYEALPLPLPLSAIEPPFLASAKLRFQGVYLITGGLGEIGLVIAHHLAETVQAKLILTGRSAFPAKENWTQWLETSPADDRISYKIKQLQAMEALGAEILVAQADVANLDQMTAVMAQQPFGAIDGLFHAAGVLHPETFLGIRELSLADCEQQFQAKMAGLFVLESILKEQNPDFCLLFSSLSSIIGGLGYLSYAAANLFMDAWVQQYTGSLPWISVNWDNWDTTLEETASAASKVELSIRPTEGMVALRSILDRVDFSHADMRQVIVSTGDLQTRIHQWVNPSDVSMPLEDTDSSFQSSTQLSVYDRPALSVPYVAPQGDIEQTLATVWKELLGIDPIGINDNFFELGGDSLLVTRFLSRLRQEFQVELSFHTLFEDPTIAGLASHIQTLRALSQNFELIDSDTEREEGEL